MNHFADRKCMIFYQIHVRSVQILWRELVLQFSTDCVVNLCPDEENTPLSRKRITAIFFTFWSFTSPTSTSHESWILLNSYSNSLCFDVRNHQRSNNSMKNILFESTLLVPIRKPVGIVGKSLFRQIPFFKSGHDFGIFCLKIDQLFDLELLEDIQRYESLSEDSN